MNRDGDLVYLIFLCSKPHGYPMNKVLTARDCGSHGHLGDPGSPHESEFVEGALTLPSFCELYATGRTTAYALIAAGVLDARKAGRRTLISRRSAKEWWESLPCLKPNPG